MRNGADFAVFVSTAQEFDGSDSGREARRGGVLGQDQGGREARQGALRRDDRVPVAGSQTFAKVPPGETRHPAGSWPFGEGSDENVGGTFHCKENEKLIRKNLFFFTFLSIFLSLTAGENPIFRSPLS